MSIVCNKSDLHVNLASYQEKNMGKWLTLSVPLFLYI